MICLRANVLIGLTVEEEGAYVATSSKDVIPIHTSLIMVQGRFGLPAQVFKVTHETRTQVHVGHTRYRRKDGRRVGRRGFETQYAVPATPQDVAAYKAEVHKGCLCRRLEDYEWRKLGVGELDAIIKIIEDGEVTTHG